MTTRLLWLKIAATLASLIAGGCSLPNSEQQAKPQQVEVIVKVEDGKITVNDAKIDVSTSASDTNTLAACSCGCNQEGCRCSRSLSSRDERQSASAGSAPQAEDKRPIVEMRSAYSVPGSCGPCNAAWQAWLTNGKNWPFRLVKVNAQVDSPSFVFRDKTIAVGWSSEAALFKAWSDVSAKEPK